MAFSPETKCCFALKPIRAAVSFINSVSFIGDESSDYRKSSEVLIEHCDHIEVLSEYSVASYLNISTF